MFDKKVKFGSMPFEDAAEKYSIEAITLDELGDLFPEDPESFFVHKGNVTIDGPLRVGYKSEDALTMYVIDGDLVVNGPFVFSNSDAYAGLFVTGNLTCDNAAVTWDAQLFVGGSMTVKGLLFTYLTDAGHFSIKGSLSAGSWLQPTFRGCIELGKKPRARLLRAGEHAYHNFREAPEDDDEAEAGEGRRYDFDPRAAVLAHGILHPSLLVGEADIETDRVAEAIAKGKPLFADGSGAAPTTAKQKKPRPKKSPKKPAPKKQPAAKKRAKKSR